VRSPRNPPWSRKGGKGRRGWEEGEGQAGKREGIGKGINHRLEGGTDKNAGLPRAEKGIILLCGFERE
jgi:hypothetical protein